MSVVGPGRWRNRPAVTRVPQRNSEKSKLVNFPWTTQKKQNTLRKTQLTKLVPGLLERGPTIILQSDILPWRTTNRYTNTDKLGICPITRLTIDQSLFYGKYYINFMVRKSYVLFSIQGNNVFLFNIFSKKCLIT